MEQDKSPVFWPLVYLSTTAFAALIIWIIIKLPPAKHNTENSFARGSPIAEKPIKETSETEENNSQLAASEANKPAETNIPPKAFVVIPPKSRPKMTIDDVLKTARTWGPAYADWYGKPAPDFTLSDINGKQHKLSDYRGKNVLIIFWATWCRPCIREIPHLIELRNSIGEDKLAILAISNESPALVKRAAADLKINYTVLCSGLHIMPPPFNSIYSIPSSFFVRPDGKIKLATEGLIQLEATKAIIQAD